MKTFDEWWDENHYEYTNVAKHQAFEIWDAARKSAAQIAKKSKDGLVLSHTDSDSDHERLTGYNAACKDIEAAIRAGE